MDESRNKQDLEREQLARQTERAIIELDQALAGCERQFTLLRWELWEIARELWQQVDELEEMIEIREKNKMDPNPILADLSIEEESS